MSVFSKLKDATDVMTGRKSLASDIANRELLGWKPLNGSSYAHYKSDDYASAYPNIRAIGDEFMTISPYAIDSNGKPVKDNNVINRLYHPNQNAGSLMFLEQLAVLYSVHRWVYILVWTFEDGKAVPGGDAGPKGTNIAGFTYLENATVTIIDGKKSYRYGKNTFTDKEVIAIPGGVNPYNLSEGYSSGVASCRWTTLDNYIAAFQSGFFENGAVPAGQFIITAATVQDYNDIVDKMQERHRGAGKNNNITYTHRPIDQNTGKVVDAQIEWVPFSQSNKDLSLKEIFEQADKRINTAFGVPASIKGDSSESKYDNLRGDEYIFMRRKMKPMVMKIWSQFTHELNRITGGLGVAIMAEVEVPELADELEVMAKTKTLEFKLIQDAIAAGFSLDSAVDAFELSNAYKLLKTSKEKPVIENDKPDVDDGNEVADSPNGDDLKSAKTTKQVAAREFDGLYDGLEIDPKMVTDASIRGCIMAKTEVLEVVSLVEDGEADLAEDVSADRSNVPGETTPHVTLLYGLLNNGNIWKNAVDTVLDGWKIDNLVIEDVSYFETPDNNVIVGHIKQTPELLDAHERLGLLPNAETFSEYKPHMSLAYISKDADIDKWVTALGKAYNGKELKYTGIDYGDLPEEAASGKGLKATKTISDDAREDYEARLSDVTRNYMESQVNRAIKVTKAVGDPSEEDQEEFVEEALKVIAALMAYQGAIEYAAGTQLLLESGLITDLARRFRLPESTIEDYRTYLIDVAESYGRDTATSIRNVLDRASIEGLSRRETEAALRNIMNTDEFRVARLARTEVNRSQGIASLDGMRQLGDDAGVTFRKVWLVRNADACPYCLALDGTSVGLDTAFVEHDHDVEGEDGSIFVNNFVDVEAGSLHPNCTCSVTYEVVK